MISKVPEGLLQSPFGFIAKGNDEVDTCVSRYVCVAAVRRAIIPEHSLTLLRYVSEYSDL